MNKRNLTLLIVLVVVSAAAVYVFKDSFQAEPIQIAYMVRPAPVPRNPKPAANDPFAPSGKPGFNVTFSFNQDLKLKAVRLYDLEEVRTNKYPHAIWNLTSESNSPPVKSIVYGGRIRGLHTTVKGAVIDPLIAGQSYRIVVETPDRTAERDFTLPR